MKQYTIIIALLGLIISGCGGEGSSFSLLSDSDTFIQSSGAINDKVDILWVVDNSGSMQPSQQNLADNFSAFISDFQSKNLDFQMAVTGTDAWVDTYLNDDDCSVFRDGPIQTPWNGSFYTGCVETGTHNGYRVMTPSTPNIIDIFTNNILQGVTGAGDERPFESMSTALNKAENSGFIRSSTGAFLAVIILTDEDDFSHPTSAFIGDNTDPALDDPQDYVDYLDGATGSASNNRRYNVNAISIQDAACRDALNDADTWKGRIIADRVNSLADLTDGFKADLCGDFATELNDIAQNILSLATQFFLTRIPNPDTIVVRVNGDIIPNKDENPGPSTGGWEYVSETNSILFSGDYIPAAGSQINVDFDPISYGS